MSIQDLFPGIYDQQAQRWILHTPEAPPEAMPRQLTIATWNVWFAATHFQERAEAVLMLLEATQADIITLQEVTPALLDIIMDTPWIQAAYRLSDIAGSSVDPYGVLILSRLPIQGWELLPLASTMGRQLVLAQLALPEPDTTIASVHLESKASMTSTRIKQLQRIFPALAARPQVILTGDFNFGANWEESQYLAPEFQDCWPLLYPHNPGFTVDTERNLMRWLAKKQDKQVRFDRIFLRSSSPGWQLEHIRLLGDNPISPDTPEIFPSDHFGLLARFGWVAVGQV